MFGNIPSCVFSAAFLFLTQQHALVRRNTSKVAKPYDIDVSVEHSANKEDAALGNNVEASK